MTTQDLRETVYTVTDFMRVATNAFQSKDIKTLENLEYIASDWMQPEEETTAQIELLNAMINTIYDIEELEG